MVRSTSAPERYFRLGFSSFLASRLSADARGQLSPSKLFSVQRRTRSCSCSRSAPCRQRRIKFMRVCLPGTFGSTQSQSRNCKVAGQSSAAGRQARPAQQHLEHQTVHEVRQLDNGIGVHPDQWDRWFQPPIPGIAIFPNGVFAFHVLAEKANAETQRTLSQREEKRMSKYLHIWWRAPSMLRVKEGYPNSRETIAPQVA
jgi:hypothetical protein